MSITDWQRYPKLDVIDNFPGWSSATGFLESLIASRNITSVADIGGGAIPLLGDTFITNNNISYSLIDVSEAELKKAPDYYPKIRVDVTAPTSEFLNATRGRTFDLVFSHMFFEHIKEPLQAHKNLYECLNPGGIAVHFFPSPNNLPLSINRWCPELVTETLLRIAQPKRDIDGIEGKFPAYYKMCGGPSKAVQKKLEEIGYSVLTYSGFIGHRYYDRIPLLRDFEQAMRGLLVRAKVPLTSAILLMLEKG